MTESESKLAAMAALMEQVGNLPFAGPTTFCRFPASRELSNVELVVLGAPLDITVFNRSGARYGPRAIRELSLLVLTELGSSQRFANRRAVDYGDTWFAPGDLAHAHARIESDAKTVLSSGARLLSLGGDHSVTLPLLRAHAQKYGPLALIQFDSHTDLYDIWPEVYHGSGIARALQEGLISREHSLQIGIRAADPPGSPEPELAQVSADWLLEHRASELVETITQRVAHHPIYVSFDIDFLDPAYAPGTGTPVIGGPTSGYARQVLRALRTLLVVGADVVEVSPPYDNPGQITALAAASVAYYLAEALLENCGRS